MKRVLIIALIFVNYSIFAQEIVKLKDGKFVKLNKDFTWEFVEQSNKIDSLDIKFNENSFSIMKRIDLKNGVDENVNCSLMVLGKKSDINGYDFNNLYPLINKASLLSMFTLKNRSTYRPLSVMVMLESEKIIVQISYSGQNDYGATKDTMKFTDFTRDGILIEK